MLSTIAPQIIILYAIDGQEMDYFLIEEMAHIIEYPLSISHKRIEDIEYNFENICENILKSNAIIMILSKEFLNTICILSPIIFQITRLLNPCKTLLIFFGCRESDMNPIHRSLLFGYGRCHRVVATPTHVKQFVINTIKLLQNILDLNEFNKIFIKRRNRFSNTPEFELSVEKIYHANQKIYILLDSAISETQRIHLSIGVSNDILIVHWKNPYTLYFTLPEFMVSYNENLEISLICGHKHLGTRNIQCLKYMQNEWNTQHNDCLSDNPNKTDETNESLMSSLNTVFTDESLPEIPVKTRFKKNPDLKTRKIYLNDEDYYIIPDTDKFKEKTAKIRQMLKTGSLDRRDFERKYSIYDIPRSLSLTRLDSSERQVFV